MPGCQVHGISVLEQIEAAKCRLESYCIFGHFFVVGVLVLNFWVHLKRATFPSKSKLADFDTSLFWGVSNGQVRE